MKTPEEIKPDPNEDLDSQGVSGKREVLRQSYFLRALIISVLLHGGVFAKFIAAEVVLSYQRAKIVSSIRKPIRIKDKKAFMEYLNSQKSSQADFGSFFLFSEFFERGISQYELDEALEELAGLIVEIDETKDREQDSKEVLRRLARREHSIRIDDQSSYMSRTLSKRKDKRKGNCEATAKLMVSVIKRIYPDMPVKYQFLRRSDTLHIRALVEIEDQWHALEEGGLVQIGQDELKGTVLADPSIFVDVYLGKKPKLDAVDLNGEPKPLEFSETDSYFSYHGIIGGQIERLRDPDAEKAKHDDIEISLITDEEMDRIRKSEDEKRINEEAERVFTKYCVQDSYDRGAIRYFIEREFKVLSLKRNPDRSWSAFVRYTSTEGSTVRECETWVPLKGKGLCSAALEDSKEGKM